MSDTTPNDPIAETIAELAAWITAQARLIDDTGKLDQEIVLRLRAAGLPIVRFTTGVPSLHPQVDSFSTLWELDKGVTFRQFQLGDMSPATLPQSPIFKTYHDGQSRRYKLTDKASEAEYELLSELRREGLTDYVVLALPFGDGTHKAMSFATDRPGGFSDAQVEILLGLRHALAGAIEVRYLRHLAGTLMDTYVGPVAGQRVLAGAIKRGSGETIRAAIWFSDLKGFTSLSERLPGPAILDVLNQYFDVITRAVETQKGEVLKFIGDAVLAIFQPTGDDDTAAARRALAAAFKATRDLAILNSQRSPQNKPVIDCGIALHFGDVIYGNVGGQKRLDFTVIGPAVNLAARIESLTRVLDQPILVSEPFAVLHGGLFETLGDHSFKGVSEPATILAPRPPGAGSARPGD